MKNRLIPALAVAALLAPASAAADTTIAAVERPTPVSAHAGRVVWSDYDPATQQFTLMQRVNGVTSPVPVPPRSAPFDVDLGPDPDGGTIAVYSRCQTEPQSDGPGVPNYFTGRRCDIYAYDFGGGSEFRIPNANSASASEVTPTVWGTRIAFVRRSTNDATFIFVRPLSSPARSTRLARVDAPTNLDLRERKLAYAELDTIRFITTTGRTRRLLADVRGAGEGGSDAGVLGAQIVGRIYYLFHEFGETVTDQSRVYRYSISSRRSERATTTQAPGAISLGKDGGDTYYVQPQRGSQGEIQAYLVRQADPLTYQAAAAPIFPPAP